MKLDATTKKHLSGESLSTGRYFPIGWGRLEDRNELLVRLCAGKKVLHVGCADHVEVIEAKRNRGVYLHEQLDRKAAMLIGLDVNEEALARMMEIGIGGLYTPETLPDNIEFDVVVIPDVIEHVRNVGLFLEGLNRIRAELFVITTPNAYRMKNRLLCRGEMINSDHRYWFSPYTLAKCVTDAGFEIDFFSYVGAGSVRRPVTSLFYVLFPLFRDGIVLGFKKGADTGQRVAAGAPCAEKESRWNRRPGSSGGTP